MSGVDIKQRLKSYGVKIGWCAKLLNLSRPTFDCYIKEFETEGQIHSEYYQPFFEHLFGASRDLTEKEFKYELLRIHHQIMKDLQRKRSKVSEVPIPTESLAALSDDYLSLRLDVLREQLVEALLSNHTLPLYWVSEYNELLKRLYD